MPTNAGSANPGASGSGYDFPPSKNRRLDQADLETTRNNSSASSGVTSYSTHNKAAYGRPRDFKQTPNTTNSSSNYQSSSSTTTSYSTSVTKDSQPPTDPRNQLMKQLDTSKVSGELLQTLKQIRNQYIKINADRDARVTGSGVKTEPTEQGNVDKGAQSITSWPPSNERPVSPRRYDSATSHTYYTPQSTSHQPAANDDSDEQATTFSRPLPPHKIEKSESEFIFYFWCSLRTAFKDQ